MGNGKPNYEHVRCDECGGIIGVYDGEHCICAKCGKEFAFYKLTYDRLLTNKYTGWVFPVIDRNEVDYG